VVPAAGCYATGRFLFSGQNETQISEADGTRPQETQTKRKLNLVLDRK
jgi:hypothetical protein